MIAADQIHPPPDRQDDTEKSSIKKSDEVPSKNSSSDVAFTKTELSNKNIQNNDSSVKPTNQKVHPNECSVHNNRPGKYLSQIR